MNLDMYQNMAKGTKKAAGLMYTGLALAGEAGECANEIKKWHRDDNEVMSPERRHKLLLELGDVLWYVASLADDLDASLETVALLNLQKLARRAEMGGGEAQGSHQTEAANPAARGRLTKG